MHHYPRLVRTLLASSLFMVATAEAVLAGPFEDATAAHQRGDYAVEHKLLLPLAEQGDHVAQTSLGFMYLKGQGVAQDYAEAAKWFGKAADQGDPDGQYNLAECYRTGKGVKKDYTQAHMWFNLAASRYPASQRLSKDNAILGRGFVASKMTQAQIAEAQKLAGEWKPKSDPEPAQ
jgi:uncharacterized protein